MIRLTLLVFLMSTPLVVAQQPQSSSERPTVTQTPPIADAIHADMQSRRYQDAVKRIETELQRDTTAAKDYLTYLKAIALRHDGKLDEARETYLSLESSYPESDWVSRSRFGRAAIAVQQRRYDEAGELYKAEAERLLSRGRKDELTEVYLEFADRFFSGEEANDPSKAKKPDYGQALEYYREAAKLGPSTARLQRIEFRIARCLEELDGNDETIAAYSQFLTDHGSENPLSGASATLDLRSEARYRLGLVQLKTRRQSAARRTWEDLIKRFETQDLDSPDLTERLAKARFQLAHTYGIPKPQSIGDLELGVALAEKFVNRYPDHELAAKAELEIAQAFEHHQRNGQTVERLEAMIANPNYAASEHLAVARRLLGQAYAAQREFQKALDAWKAFLDHHPTDSNWPDVQQKIIATEYRAADHARTEKHYDQARSLWQTFLNKYPLDPRSPSILFQFGQMNYLQASEHHRERIDAAISSGNSVDSVTVDEASRKGFESAIADWKRLVDKYPDSNEASAAGLRIGITYETYLERRKDALEAYKLVKGSSEEEAKKRIKRLTEKQLQVMTKRKFRSDEKPSIVLTTRNLENVTIEVYSIDMVDYFRKMHLATGVEKLDIALIDPDQQIEHSVAGYESYKEIEQEVALPIDHAGVSAITVSSDKQEATTMLVVSDIDIVVKASRNELFVFAQNMRTGKPAPDVGVLVSDGSNVFSELSTDEEGIALSDAKDLRNARDLRVFASTGNHIASTESNLNGLDFAVGLTPTGHLMTDRPLYRPGELVNIKAIVRWVDQDRFTFNEGDEFTLDVLDPRGRKLKSTNVALNGFGTIQSNLVLPESTPAGQCRIHLHRPSSPNESELSFESKFEVRQFNLEPIELVIETDKSVYFRGEAIEAKVRLQYYYGAPLADETITYSLSGEDETQTAVTDQEGKVALTFPTDRMGETQPLQVSVACDAHNVRQSKTVFLATRGFQVNVATTRSVYIAGETFDATLSVADPSGDPIATDLKLELFEVTREQGRTGERLISTDQLRSDEQDGKVTTTLSVEQGGTYRIRATGVDQFENDVSGVAVVKISGDEDATRLRILADKHNYQVGEEAKVRIHWREQPSLALVTYDGARVLGHRLVELKSGDNEITIPMESHLAPNFALSVCVMERNRFHQSVSEFVVAKRLNIKLTPHKTELQPTEVVKIGIEVTDASGNPVAAELTMAMIHQSLFDRFGDAQFVFDDRFGKGLRRRSLRQTSSCTFSYATKTRQIGDALLAESRRLSERSREAIAMDRLFDVDADGAVTEFEFRDRDFSNSNSLYAGGMGGGMPNEAANDPFGDSDPFAGSLTPQQLQSLGTTRSLAIAAQSRSAQQQMEQMPMQMSVPNVTGDFAVAIPQQRQQLQSFYSQLPMQQRQALPQQPGRSRLNTEPLAQNRLPKSWGVDRFDTWNRRWFEQREVTINSLSLDGKLSVVNGMGQAEFEHFVSTEGARLLSQLVSGETGFWDPVIVTDDQGKAEIEFTMPAESTAWKLQAGGVTTTTLTGDASVDLVTRKELFGRLKVPQAFTVGDKAEVEVEVHSSLEGKQSFDISLKATMDKKTTTQRESIDVDGPGIHRVSLPIAVEPCDEITFELEFAAADNVSDRYTKAVPVMPYGFPVFATASGTFAQNTLATLQFDERLAARQPKLEILIGSNPNQSLIDALVRGDVLLPRRCIATGVLDRSVSDCLAGVAVLKMIRQSSQSDSPQAVKVSEIVAGALSNLIASQRKDGGWSHRMDSGDGEPMLSARVMWAIAAARNAGFDVPNEQFESGSAFLKKAFSRTNDRNRQAILLASQSVCGCGDFALANRLYRERNQLDALGLAYLMLALTHLEHDEMASELTHLIKPDQPRQPFETGRTQTEILAVELLALQSMRAQESLRAALAKRLLETRAGSRWPIETDNGPAIAALAAHFSSAPPRNEKLNLLILVNGKRFDELEIDPGAPGKRLSVPNDFLVDGKQTIEFELTGRGEFSYSAVLRGFSDAESLASTTNDWSVQRRYEPDQLRLDGKTIPRGHGVINGSYSWTPNTLSQLPVGVRGQVTLFPRVRYQSSKPIRAYLMLIEPIPAGCTVLEDSISGVFERYEITPGAITFYLGDHRAPGNIRYTLAGYVPGQYRVAPAVLRSYHAPEEIAVSKTAQLEVLPSGATSQDEYRLTPDELFALGKAYFAKKEYQKAFEHLDDLHANWKLDPNPYKESATMLFRSALQLDAHSDAVRYFEIVKERFPDVELSFEEILGVAASYREIAEYERSYLVYRATVQGSFERESQVAGFLNGRGEFLRSVQTMESLLKDYPAESYVATANYALAQEVYRRAESVSKDEQLREAGVTRVDLINGSVTMLDHFVTNWPADPSADQASFALATALIDLNQYQQAIARGRQYAERYPESRLLDSFWYMIGFCYFELQNHQKALELCAKVAETEFTDEQTGITRSADNKWEAIYIMGQIHHSLGQAAKAIDEYTKVNDRFKDAAEAIEFFTRKAIQIPDVTTLLPSEPVELTLEHRNLRQAFVKVYRIDLMKFGLTQRNLDRVTAINLAGIKPYHEMTVALGDGKDFRDRETQLSLPLKEQGAYLVVCRGENLYSSGLIVVSPLELAIQEDATSGRVRVSVKNKSEDAFTGDVHVKVIGSANEEFVSGETDLRGLFVADDIRGTSTVIAVAENDQYAFYRGSARLQDSREVRQMEAAFGFDANEEMQQQAAEPAQVPQEGNIITGKKQLLNNVFMQNGVFQQEQQLNYDGLMNNTRKGVQTKEAY